MKISDLIDKVNSGELELNDEIAVVINPHWISTNDGYVRANNLMVEARTKILTSDIDIDRVCSVRRDDIAYGIRVIDKSELGVSRKNTVTFNLNL